MTWNRIVKSPTAVTAYKTADENVSLNVGMSSVVLSAEDAASLGGYLLGIADDKDKPAEPDNG